MLFQATIADTDQNIRMIAKALMQDDILDILSDLEGMPVHSSDAAGAEAFIRANIVIADRIILDIKTKASHRPASGEDIYPVATMKAIEDAGGRYIYINEGEFHPAGRDIVIPAFALTYDGAKSRRSEVIRTGDDVWQPVVRPKACPSQVADATAIEAMIKSTHWSVFFP